MTSTLSRLLLALACSLAAIDIAWCAAAHFRLEAISYLGLGLLSAALFAGSAAYSTLRPDPRLAAMLFGTGFLCLFSAGASVLNYCLLTVAGPRIDEPLAALDRAMGFDWPAAMVWLAGHEQLNAVLLAAYSSMLPQVALTIIVLARAASYQAVYRFCFAVATGALVCIAMWTIAPSFGAFSVYALPRAAAHLPLALDQDYAKALVALLREGPGVISPREAKGLIGFPSYHAVLALLVIAYGWPVPALRWPVLTLNLVVLIATPLEGGHHLVDVLAGFPVAALSVALAGRFKAPEPVPVHRMLTPPAEPVLPATG